MPKKHLTKTADDLHSLGELKSVNHVRISAGYFLPHLIFLGILSVGIFMFLSAIEVWKEIVSGLACVIMPFLIFAFTVWKTLPSLSDELRIYENGFVYQSRRKIQTCLWEEIKDHGGVLDFDDRLKMTSVVKKNGEKIVFAYKMQGEDELEDRNDLRTIRQESESPEISPPEASTQNQTLGELQSVHRAGIAGNLFLVFFTLFIAAFGFLIFFASKDILALFVCTIPLALPFCGVTWTFFRDMNDELRIYQNGLTYKSRRKIQTCFWSDITDWSMTSKGGITGVKKENGEWISFATGVEAEDELKSRVKKVIPINSKYDD